MLGLAITLIWRASRFVAIAAIAIGVVSGWVALANTPDATALVAEAVNLVKGWAFAVQKHPDVLVPAYTVTGGPSVEVVVAGAAVAVVGGLLTLPAIPPDDPTGWIPWSFLAGARSTPSEAA